MDQGFTKLLTKIKKTMSNEDVDLSNDDIVLSRRNEKKLAKVANKFNEKIKTLEEQNSDLLSEINSLKDEIELNRLPDFIEKKKIISDYDKAHEEYLESQIQSKETEKQLSPYSSSMSTYAKEIIWFSVIIGLVFDFLLWKNIFAGKFGSDAWAQRAEKASAIILSFSYAFMCSQLGAAYAIKMLVKKRSQSSNEKEVEVYNKSTAKDTMGINIFLFCLLTILSTAARYTQVSLTYSDKFILSLAATSIGLVIAAIAYWYTDVYEHFINAAKSKEMKARKNFYMIEKKMKGKKYGN
jgi:hypothetical protein